MGPGGSVAPPALIPGEFLADGALAAADGPGDLSLGFSCLPHVGNHVTFFRTEAVVFVVHSQFVLDQTGRIPASDHLTFIHWHLETARNLQREKAGFNHKMSICGD